ncbi:MAG: hypothetical protein ACYC6L_14210, partial [Anaerolineae bacterium]
MGAIREDAAGFAGRCTINLQHTFNKWTYKTGAGLFAGERLFPQRETKTAIGLVILVLAIGVMAALAPGYPTGAPADVQEQLPPPGSKPNTPLTGIFPGENQAQGAVPFEADNRIDWASLVGPENFIEMNGADGAISGTLRGVCLAQAGQTDSPDDSLRYLLANDNRSFYLGLRSSLGQDASFSLLFHSNPLVYGAVCSPNSQVARLTLDAADRLLVVDRQPGAAAMEIRVYALRADYAPRQVSLTAALNYT